MHNSSMTASNTVNSDLLPTPQIAGHLLVQCLIAQGVTHAFGVPGESYLAVLDGVTLADLNAPAATVVQLPPSRRGARMPGLPLAPDQA